jgi:hypothetical protein
MQTANMDKPTQENTNILILADFSEGNLAAIHFAMRYLYRPGSVIHFLQTWQKPNFGSSMVRDLSPMLQSIANSELEGLKSRLKTRYSLPDAQIRLISFEGDLPAFFKTETYQSQQWQLVLGTRDNGGSFTNMHRMTELINKVSQDLYVLTGLNRDKIITDVFMLADTQTTSSSTLSVLKKIAISERPNLSVCLASSLVSPGEKKKSVALFVENCKGAKLFFTQVENGEGQRELREFSKVEGGKLMVFERNPKRKLQNGLKSCLDSWFLKSKGIRIGNY